MCRSIKVLNRSDGPATPDELRGAALQFVRKISGYTKPSRVNQEAFDRAVQEITACSQQLMESIVRGPDRRRRETAAEMQEATTSDIHAAKPEGNAARLSHERNVS